MALTRPLPTAPPPPVSALSTIRYLERLELYRTEKPYEVIFPPVNVSHTDARQTNLSFQSFPVELRDMRSSADTFSTDIQGFTIEQFPTSLTVEELKDQGAIKDKYFPEVEAFLQSKFSAFKTCIFDVTVRQISEKKPELSSSALLRNTQVLGAARDCHVDQSPGSVRRRVEALFPEEAEELLKHRVRVINIWRPLVWPSHTFPLAMCDWRSTEPRDYTRSDHATPVWIGESLQIYHNPKHQWWFAARMDERCHTAQDV